MQPNLQSEALATVGKHLTIIEGAEKSAKKNGRPRPQLETVDALDIFKREFPEPQFLIDDLLPNGVTILAGRPKSGKSWLTLQIAISVACGSPLFGEHKTKQGRVTYLALEEPESRTHHRLKRLINPSECDTPFLQNISFVYRIPPLLAGGKEMLDDHLAAHPSQLCVIDTLLAIVQNRSSKDVMRSDYTEVNELRKLAERHNTAILLVAHSRKMGADYHVDTVAGTSGVTAACDAIWSLKKKPEGATLDITGREFEENVIGLRFDTDVPFGWQKTGEGEAVANSEEREEIITLLGDEAPLSPKAIADGLRKNRNTIRRLLQKMYCAGAVVKNSDGRYCLASGV
ncbi:MAG: AAA family ATPase [Acidobacteria bacterium]|nr:AAA family ATPase [Acidobacteriota bacterium]